MIGKLLALKLIELYFIITPKLSRRAIRRALDSGLVTVNGKVERFASRVVHAGHIILIKVVEEKRESTKINILEPFIVYEDDAIIAINKPLMFSRKKP